MIKVYRDDRANAIFFEDANGAQFLNSLQAQEGSTTVSVHDLVRGIDIVSDRPFGDFVDENDDPYGTDAATTTNALNAIFGATGGDAAPVITSPTSINALVGDIINYELIATGGVGYEWDSLPAGLTTVEGNVRKLIGSLSAGTYTPTMRAINYFGTDTETLTITVSTPPFANTKSVEYQQNDYCQAAATTANPFYRASNGTGAADAWSVSFYFKPGTSNNSEQTIVMFGGASQANDARVQIFDNGSGGNHRLVLWYGSNNNYLRLTTAAGTLPSATWTHVLVTYDGGTTGSSSGSLPAYYGRFKIYLDGVLASTTNTNGNFGTTTSVNPDFFRLARNGSATNTLRAGARLDEVALWASDQSANVASIYNGGAPFDLSTLGTPPDHWWRMGDGDTFPALQDNVGALDFTMVNMTAASIINDVP